MKILHVTKKYPNALGGDAVVVSNLEKQQKKAGDSVAILTSNCDEIISGDHIYKFGLKDTPASLDNITVKRLLSLVMLFFKAYSVFKKERPDVIHTHSVDMAFFVSFAARHYKIPIVHTFHIVTFNDPRHAGLRANIELKFLAGAKPTRIFLLNPADIKDFEAAGFHNAVFVPNGVNIEDWHVPGAQKNKLFTFIAVGRLEEQKGFKYLIEAAAKLRETSNDFQVQIIGEGSEQGMLENLIIQHELKSCFFLLGRKSPKELKQLYASANVFVLSSLWEGMPLSLLEAWAVGLPAIATSVNSVPYIAQGSVELISSQDSMELSIAMSRLMTHAETRNKYAQNAAKVLSQKYTWGKVSALIRALYSSEVSR